MNNYKNLIYTLLCLCLSIIVGAGLYEHLAVWPRAYTSPPKSLSMFQGEFGINPNTFWAKIHPITLLFFVTVLFLFWKSERRKFVLIPFIGYVMLIIATFTYFVPELIDIVSTRYGDSINQGLIERGSRWEILSLIRLALVTILALFLFWGLTKSNYIISNE